MATIGIVAIAAALIGIEDMASAPIGIGDIAGDNLMISENGTRNCVPNSGPGQHATRKEHLPKTPEGKAKSARNATKHGVLSNEPLLVNENPACYEELLHAHIERFQPADEVELEIVHVMAFPEWRQRRAWNNEPAMIDMQMHEEQELLKAKFEKFDEATRIAHAAGACAKHIARHGRAPTSSRRCTNWRSRNAVAGAWYCINGRWMGGLFTPGIA